MEDINPILRSVEAYAAVVELRSALPRNFEQLSPKELPYTLMVGVRPEMMKTVLALIEAQADVVRSHFDRSPMRLTEMSLAYERATGVIETHCINVGADGQDVWDLDSTKMDLSEEVDYLDSRNLLQRPNPNPRWVMICDEDEPMPLAGKVAA